MTEDHEHEWHPVDSWMTIGEIDKDEDGTPYAKNHKREVLWVCECGAEKTITHD